MIEQGDKEEYTLAPIIITQTLVGIVHLKDRLTVYLMSLLYSNQRNVCSW